MYFVSLSCIDFYIKSMIPCTLPFQHQVSYLHFPSTSAPLITLRQFLLLPPPPPPPPTSLLRPIMTLHSPLQSILLPFIMPPFPSRCWPTTIPPTTTFLPHYVHAFPFVPFHSPTYHLSPLPYYITHLLAFPFPLLPPSLSLSLFPLLLARTVTIRFIYICLFVFCVVLHLFV